jgi:drug/metabolite transporter (DMT)-like permease
MFAVNGTVSKLILQAGLDAPRLTALRAAGAFLGLLGLSALAPRGRTGGSRWVPGLRRLAATRRELPLLIGYGLAGFFLVPMLYFVAIGRLPVGVALLFEYTAPLLVTLWARFGQGQPSCTRRWTRPSWPVGR